MYDPVPATGLVSPVYYLSRKPMNGDTDKGCKKRPAKKCLFCARPLHKSGLCDTCRVLERGKAERRGERKYDHVGGG